MIDVLFVREIDGQMSNSGCCGRMEGDITCWNGEHVFKERREIMEQLGEIYRELKAHYHSDITLDMIDPRNIFSYFIVGYQHGKRAGLSFLERMKQLIQGYHTTAILINGRVYCKGEIPDKKTILEYIDMLKEG